MKRYSAEGDGKPMHKCNLTKVTVNLQQRYVLYNLDSSWPDSSTGLRWTKQTIFFFYAIIYA